MALTMKSEGIKIEGYRGKWHVVDESFYYGKQYFLLEHSFYGDETCFLVVDSDANLICETFDSLDEALEEEIEIPYRTYLK